MRIIYFVYKGFAREYRVKKCQLAFIVSFFYEHTCIIILLTRTYIAHISVEGLEFKRVYYSILVVHIWMHIFIGSVSKSAHCYIC